MDKPLYLLEFKETVEDMIPRQIKRDFNARSRNREYGNDLQKTFGVCNTADAEGTFL